ncbi:MAG: hypothetical protein QW533_06555 [Thermoplasmata archaeon]
MDNPIRLRIIPIDVKSVQLSISAVVETNAIKTIETEIKKPYMTVITVPNGGYIYITARPIDFTLKTGEIDEYFKSMILSADGIYLELNRDEE